MKTLVCATCGGADIELERTFQTYPNESKTVSKMIDEGYWITNPEEEGNLPPASMYFDTSQLEELIKIYGRKKIWTLIEEDGKGFLVERIQIVNRQAYLVAKEERKKI